VFLDLFIDSKVSPRLAILRVFFIVRAKCFFDCFLSWSLELVKFFTFTRFLLLCSRNEVRPESFVRTLFYFSKLFVNTVSLPLGPLISRPSGSPPPAARPKPRDEFYGCRASSASPPSASGARRSCLWAPATLSCAHWLQRLTRGGDVFSPPRAGG
jgi:hypothetical protein